MGIGRVVAEIQLSRFSQLVSELYASAIPYLQIVVLLVKMS